MKKTPVIAIIAVLMFFFVMWNMSGAMKWEKPETKRPGILKTVTQGDAVPVRLLNPNETQGLLQEGNMEIFRHAGRKTVTSVGILCPGHRDYVKNTISLLSDQQNWINLLKHAS